MNNLFSKDLDFRVPFMEGEFEKIILDNGDLITKPKEKDLEEWLKYREGIHYFLTDMGYNGAGLKRKVANDISDMLITLIDKELNENMFINSIIYHIEIIQKSIRDNNNSQDEKIFKKPEFQTAYIFLVGVIRAFFLNYLAFKNGGLYSDKLGNNIKEYIREGYINGASDNE